MINEELDMLRLASTILERRDTIVVASVACIYATSDPEYYRGMLYTLRVEQEIGRENYCVILYRDNMFAMIWNSLVVLLEFEAILLGEIVPGHSDDTVIRVEFFGDEIERIVELDKITGHKKEAYMVYHLFPANEYARDIGHIRKACLNIEKEMHERLAYFQAENKLVEEQRLRQRLEHEGSLA